MGLVISPLELRGAIFVLLLLLPNLSFAEEPAKVSVCLSCHREMGGGLAQPVSLWEKSIHAQLGNNCEGCHGGDPNDEALAMSPEKGFVGSPKPEEIPDFCGKCHVGVMENYKKSPHYSAFRRGIGPSCVTCHKSHDVERASFDLIDETLCSQCHSYENGRKMKQAFISAELELQKMKSTFHKLDRRGMPVRKFEEKLFAERNALHQMTHTLDVMEIEKKTELVLTNLEVMKQETAALWKKVKKRWAIGSLVGLFLILFILLLIKLHRSLEEE